MESTARYITIGFFLTIVAVIGFGFVYWLNHGNGLQETAVYRIRFLHPATGLRPGTAVLFNGIRVGEVTDLTLDERSPRELMAAIRVARNTPIRVDTRVDVQSQGLMGAPALMLEGGDGSSPTLIVDGGMPPILTARLEAGADMIQAARETLSNLNKVVVDNSESLHSGITNLKTFSEVLAQNSDKLNTVIEGVVRMVGAASGKGPSVTWDLSAVQNHSDALSKETAELRISEVSAILAVDSQKILIRSERGEFKSFPDQQWSDILGKLVQMRILQSFENAGYVSIARGSEMEPDRIFLALDIRSFWISSAPEPMANVELGAKIIRDNRVVKATVFQAKVPGSEVNVGIATQALNVAFMKVVSELMAWTSNL